MKVLRRLIVAGFVFVLLLQCFRPSIPARPAAAEVQAPPQVRQILRNSCYSCHSDERHLAWFDQIVPAYWLVRSDVLTARQHLNFSTLGSKPPAVQRATLFEAVNMIQLGAMPLPRFTALHPNAKVSPEDLGTVKAWLAPWPPLATPSLTPPAASPIASEPITLAQVKPEWSGLAFDPSFESWRHISTTDRGDNNSLRVILGNDIAIRAAQSGNITPWPDGARFAKIAWQKLSAPDGLIHPGSFIQVELMVKDANRYKSTEGWGWGRWRTLSLQPYGKDAGFVTECTTCHMPVLGNDAVYTLPITQAHIERAEVVNNHAASLPSTLPYQPLGWRVITLYVNPQTHTTAILFGNDTAMSTVQPRTPAPSAPPTYAVGSVLALVTWSQRDDPHWFGARIPDIPRSVEFVQVAAAAQNSRYRRFTGSSLSEDPSATTQSQQRISFILGLPPASLP
jgi:mono/diheme cytochrome c family protein